MVLPTDLNMSTNVMPHVICAGVLWNSFDSWSTVRDTVKKSKASHDHARKATRKNSHCWVLSCRRSEKGLGALCMGGLRVGSRVAMYRPILMCSSWSLYCVGDGSRSFSFWKAILFAASEAGKEGQLMKHEEQGTNLKQNRDGRTER